MRRILAATALAAAVVAPATATAGHGACGGVVDVDCTGYFCAVDCFSSHCTVWLDPLHNPHAALCLL